MFRSLGLAEAAGWLDPAFVCAIWLKEVHKQRMPAPLIQEGGPREWNRGKKKSSTV